MEKIDFIDSLIGDLEGMDDSDYEEAVKKEADEKRKRKIALFNSLVPLRYRGIEFTADKSFLEQQRSVIYGAYGTGKTYLGYSIAKELFISGKVSEFTIEREREIYNTILSCQNTPSEYKKRYFEPDLLVIDEFGKNSLSDASASQIFNIIDYRYDWKKRTILICNAANDGDLGKIIPKAIQDRFKGSTYQLSGESRRVKE